MKHLQLFHYIRKQVVTGTLACLFAVPVQAQISSPGLGKAHTALWMAVGLKQQLDSAGKIQSMTYIGNGRISTPADYNLAERPAIWVINQEFYFQLQKHWQVSAAISYRKQNEYKEEAPYDLASPNYKHEFRAYARLIYQLKFNRLKFAFTLRQEFRKFFTPDLHKWEESLQLRTRFRTQAIYTLDQKAKHKLTVSGEPLFSLSHEIAPHQTWTGFGYHESRFSFFYSFSPGKQNLVYSLGYMNDLIGNHTHQFTDVHYLAVDLTWKNPFGKLFHSHKH